MSIPWRRPYNWIARIAVVRGWLREAQEREQADDVATLQNYIAWLQKMEYLSHREGR